MNRSLRAIIMQFVFGSIQTYTCVKSVTLEDEEVDPFQHFTAMWLLTIVPPVRAFDFSSFKDEVDDPSSTSHDVVAIMKIPLCTRTLTVGRTCAGNAK